MAMHDNYQLLIDKLDGFIRKFYVNKLIRGALYSTGLILGLFLAFALLENEFYFDTTVRKVLFYSLVGTMVAALGYWVIDPALRYFRLGKQISHERAAQIIGDHFTGVKDKLLNILQLRQQAAGQANTDLILASINQKSEEIKPVPFQAAINLAQNRKYLRYALPPLLVLLVLLFAAPSIIRDSTRRLIQNGKEFLKPAPFSYALDEKELKVIQFQDYELKVSIEGSQLPNEVFIEVDDYAYRMTKNSPSEFSYTFNKVQKDLRFSLTGGGVESQNYLLEVIKKPNIRDFEVRLNYPDYVGREDELLQSVGDLVLPVGTQIQWLFNTESTDEVKLRFMRESKAQAAKRQGNDFFVFGKKAMLDDTYKLIVANAALPKGDSVTYSMTIIPDQYPEISVKPFEDSTNTRQRYFAGEASDDYGLRSVTFNYRIRKPKGDPGQLQTTFIQKPEGKSTTFDYAFDVNKLGLEPGDELSYYFEVKDNDAVNGSKSARSGMMVFAMPTIAEMEQQAEANDDKVKDALKDALAESKKLEAEIRKLQEKMLQEKDISWQDRKQMEKLMERQKELEKQIEEAKEAFEENLKNQEQLGETPEELKEKQEKMQELFESLEDKEMKELMEQIEKLMQQMEKDQAMDMMKQMQQKDQQRQKELSRMKELFKQLELEQEQRKAIEKLEELAKEQENLAQKTEDKKESSEELQKKQEELNKDFKELEKKAEDIQKKNEELEKPQKLDDPKQDMKDIEKDMKDSKEDLEKQENQKAAKKQKSAAKKMKQMASKMKQQMQQNEMESLEEDIATLRQLLENLVGLSFDQEDLMKALNKTEINTPRYVQHVQRQFKVKDDFRMVEDSLQALAKRSFQIEGYVVEKVEEINSNMGQSIVDLEEREKSSAADHQQRTMKNLNDLALMFSEIMNNAQQKMGGMMSGNQNCDNPNGSGKGNTPSDQISKGQGGLNGEMQNAKDKLGNKEDGAPSSKDFAQMAAKQAALRKALEEQQKKLKQQGKGSKELQDIIDQMERSETELVNKRLSNETMRRQQDILTRLLEHEKAERERDQDEKRKSTAAQQYERKMPPALEEYLKKRKAEVDAYKTVSPALKPYYKSLVEEYFKSLKK
jgi:hypothetical protein